MTKKKNNSFITTSSRKVEKLLCESEEKFHFFSEQALLGIAIIQDDRVKYANRAIADLLEYSIEEILSWKENEFSKVIHPDDLKFAMDQTKKKQAGDKDTVDRYSFRFVTQSGRTKWVDQYSKTVSYQDRNADLVTVIDITGKKEAEVALMESEELYRDLMESMNDGLCMLDESGQISYANDKICRLLGYTQDEMMGHPVPDFIDDNNMKLLTDNTSNDSINSRRSCEIALTRKDQSQLFTIFSISPIHDAEGNYKGSLAVATDISERILVEKALKDSEAQYRELFNSVIEGLGLVDENEVVQFHNPAFANIFEDNPECDLVGRSLYDYVIEDYKGIIKNQTAQRKKNTSSTYEVVINSAGGIEKCLLVSVSPRFDKQNYYIGSFGSVIDISDRKRAEAKLKKAYDKLEILVKERTEELDKANRLKRRMFDLYSIFELSRNFNALLDLESLIDSFMLAALSKMGTTKAAIYLPLKIGQKKFHLTRIKGNRPYPKDEIEIDPSGKLCRYITDLNRPVHIDEIIKKFASSEDVGYTKYFPGGLMVPMVFQMKLRGVLIISGRESGQPYRASDIEFLSISASQTTVSIENVRLYESEKEALGKLQKTQELLVESERSAALGDLSARIAHEINNPLGIIRNYLSLVTRDLDDEEKARQYIGIVKHEIERVAGIVRQLLDFNRPRVSRYVKTIPEVLISEVLLLMERQFENAGISVSFHVDDNVPVIKAWPDGLKQVFINLLANAREAMKDGGAMFIDISRNEHTVLFTMRDTGTGIDPKYIPRIFDSFFTTREDSGGTGLGLSVCRRIIKNHNGTISYHNTDDGGCFEIELPIEQEELEYDWRI